MDRELCRRHSFGTENGYMEEVVVYLKLDYSINESIYVRQELTNEEVTKLVNENFDEWCYYDRQGIYRA